MVPSLCRSYWHAIDMLEHVRTYYQNLTDETRMTAVYKWTDDIKRVESNCRQDIKVMDVYAAKLAKDLADNRQPASETPRTPLSSWMELSPAVEGKQ